MELICGHNFKDFVCDGKLILIAADEPWNNEHYMCEKCDSTYNKWQRDKPLKEDKNYE